MVRIEIYFLWWRLGFCGKSVRENASPTESAFEMSSKLGNTCAVHNLKFKVDAFCINAGGTAGIIILFTRPGNIYIFPGHIFLVRYSILI